MTAKPKSKRRPMHLRWPVMLARAKAKVQKKIASSIKREVR